MAIPQFTTPTVTIAIPEESGIDLTQATKLVLTFEAGDRKVEKTGEDLTITAHTVGAELTQQESSQLRVGPCFVTANFLIAGKRGSTEPVEVEITRNAHNEVM